MNPVTGEPYEPQIVPRADYSRVLAEFWADGPQSETPPGHWFTITNSVLNHPLFEKRWEGQGEIMNDLEFDVRTYLAIGGAVHDAAVACWSAKGFYDYTRPIMAIRYMIDHGQCSDMNLPSYDPAGIPLIPGFIELVQAGDPLAGDNDENVNKVKLYTFRGPVEATGLDGVGWILGENWWTFQVRTFVTPPFPGYYSGHSTYSRTAAEVLTALTGSEYFPGGLGEFFAAQDEYLRASPGPSVDVHLQWASYKDASDQCSLSRIYGGLHPPCDDIPGRIVGTEIAPMVFDKANGYYNAGIPHVMAITSDKSMLTDADAGTQVTLVIEFSEDMDEASVPAISFPLGSPAGAIVENNASWIDATHYQIVYDIFDIDAEISNVVAKVQTAMDLQSNEIVPALQFVFNIDMANPAVADINFSENIVNDEVANNGIMILNIVFDEAMNTDFAPVITYPVQDISGSMMLNESLSYWQDDMTYVAIYDLVDDNNDAGSVTVVVAEAQDAAGNLLQELTIEGAFVVDTENPILASAEASHPFINTNFIGAEFTVSAMFAEEMDPNFVPVVAYSSNEPFINTLGTLVSEGWSSGSSYEWTYSVNASDEELPMVFISVSGGQDMYGNPQVPQDSEPFFGVDTHPATLVSAVSNASFFNDALSGTECFQSLSHLMMKWIATKCQPSNSLTIQSQTTLWYLMLVQVHG
ncbi:MAG: vanadium-dependent haloperoxidase [Flavobacteriales bacterium]